MSRQSYEDRFEQFYDGHMGEEAATLASEYAPDDRSLRIDYQELHDADPSLAEDFLERPDTLRQPATKALKGTARGLQKSIQHAGPHAQVNIRIRNLPEDHHRLVGKCRTRDLGTLLSVDGQVADVDRVSPHAEIAAWECQRCGTLTRQHQVYGKMVEPHECQGCEASGPFVLNQTESDLVDHQEIGLIPPDTQLDDPPFLPVFLNDDITDSVGKGDVVTVVGVYEVLPGQNETVLDTYLDAYDLDVEEYAEAGVDSRELQADIVAFVTENQEKGSGWGVDRDRVLGKFEAEGVRRREIENTIDEAKDEGVLSEANGKLADPDA